MIFFTSLFNQSQTTKHPKQIQRALHAFAPVHLSLQSSCQDQLEEHHSLETCMTAADHPPARSPGMFFCDPYIFSTSAWDASWLQPKLLPSPGIEMNPENPGRSTHFSPLQWESHPHLWRVNPKQRWKKHVKLWWMELL